MIEGNIVYEELNLNIKLTEIRSTVLSSEDKIKEYLLIINNADILVNELKINAFKNIFFKIINVENFIYQLNTSAEGSGFIGSDDGQMKIDLNGNYQIKNRNLEGNRNYFDNLVDGVGAQSRIVFKNQLTVGDTVKFIYKRYTYSKDNK